MEQDVAAEQIASQNQRRLLNHLPGARLPLLVSVTKSLSMSLSLALSAELDCLSTNYNDFFSVFVFVCVHVFIFVFLLDLPCLLIFLINCKKKVTFVYDSSAMLRRLSWTIEVASVINRKRLARAGSWSTFPPLILQ